MDIKGTHIRCPVLTFAFSHHPSPLRPAAGTSPAVSGTYRGPRVANNPVNLFPRVVTRPYILDDSLYLEEDRQK
jgi:hypothetical protein